MCMCAAGPPVRLAWRVCVWRVVGCTTHGVRALCFAAHPCPMWCSSTVTLLCMLCTRCAWPAALYLDVLYIRRPSRDPRDLQPGWLLLLLLRCTRRHAFAACLLDLSFHATTCTLATLARPCRSVSWCQAFACSNDSDGAAQCWGQPSPVAAAPFNQFWSVCELFSVRICCHMVACVLGSAVHRGPFGGEEPALGEYVCVRSLRAKRGRVLLHDDVTCPADTAWPEEGGGS